MIDLEAHRQIGEQLRASSFAPIPNPADRMRMYIAGCQKGVSVRGRNITAENPANVCPHAYDYSVGVYRQRCGGEITAEGLSRLILTGTVLCVDAMEIENPNETKLIMPERFTRLATGIMAPAIEYYGQPI